MGVCVLRVLRGETVFVFLDRRRRANQHAVRVSSLVFLIPVNRKDSLAMFDVSDGIAVAAVLTRRKEFRLR